MDFVELITSNPAWTAAIVSAVAAVVAFFKPVMRAGQKALIRRINQSWPDGVNGRSSRDSVVPVGASEQEAVESIVAHVRKKDWMTRTLPVGLVKHSVRNKHDSDWPPNGDL